MPTVHIVHTHVHRFRIDHLQAHLRKWFEVAVASQKGGVVKITGHVVSNELKTCAAIINIFHLIPAASTKMIEPLLTLTLKGERDLVIEVRSS